MKRKYLSLAILNFGLAILWMALLVAGAAEGESVVPLVLRGVCVVLTVITGMLHLVMYRKEK